jgi:phosphoribosylformylglycinamidine cyclo-ligase
VGAVERAKLIDGTQVRAGDAIVGLASSGVHANGFSLIRRVMGAAQLRRLSRQLLTPTRIYVKPVLEALTQISVRAIAHVTGGGLTRRLPSLVARSRGVRAQLVAGSWPVPPIFGVIQRQGGIDTDEMRRTFNMGIGLALVCPARQTSTLIRIMRRHGVPAWPIGTIVRSRS